MMRHQPITVEHIECNVFNLNRKQNKQKPRATALRVFACSINLSHPPPTIKVLRIIFGKPEQSLYYIYSPKSDTEYFLLDKRSRSRISQRTPTNYIPRLIRLSLNVRFGVMQTDGWMDGCADHICSTTLILSSLFVHIPTPPN